MSKSIYHFTYQQHKLLCCFTVDSKKSVFKRKCNRMLYLAYLKPSNVIQTSLDRSKKKRLGEVVKCFKKTSVWNIILVNRVQWQQVIVFWVGVKGACLKGSVIHKHGWGAKFISSSTILVLKRFRVSREISPCTIKYLVSVPCSAEYRPTMIYEWAFSVFVHVFHSNSTTTFWTSNVLAYLTVPDDENLSSCSRTVQWEAALVHITHEPHDLSPQHLQLIIKWSPAALPHEKAGPVSKQQSA